MSDGRIILSSILNVTQSGQEKLIRAIDKAASTAIISVLASHLETFDRIESEALRLATRRGWEVPEDVASPLRRKNTFICLPCMGKTDSKIAEAMIRYHTGRIICELKVSHTSRSADRQIQELLQKLLCCQSDCIRQMEPFL